MAVKSLEELLEKGSLWCPEGKSSRAVRRINSFSSVSFGLAEVDSALAVNGLLRGAIHEFCASEFYHSASNRRKREECEVPLSILTMLAVQAADAAPEKYTLWIGKICRPNPVFIRNFLSSQRTEIFFSRSLFIDPPDEKKLLWSVEAGLRSPAVVSVIANINNSSLPLSRRLSLSAKSAQTLGLFVVPSASLSTPTAAATRWRIRPVVSPSMHARFELSLLKQKGGAVRAAPWIFELIDDGEKISFNIPADVVDKSRAKKGDKIRRQA